MKNIARSIGVFGLGALDIAGLPEDQRTLVVLRDIEGRSYEEIAETTGLNPGTVKSRLNRGRRQLQEWLRDCFLMGVLLALGLGA